ncbi:type II toxin-antitoxin system prevent-host-death family antitoxin [Acidimicrobiaceae bacterium USS-CC1]|uniref:Antitoxin n=1 Tax=Acidiferrimicrobium australe TaxID=2664430 RepID=A0ABW9QUB2_9ACTN|nr:type II toxin-antitoxin system prevent-host-death family antitoxin [Acidiferrimicrobium australe]
MKDRLPEHGAGVERTHDRVMITRHGRAAAVLISIDDLAALEAARLHPHVGPGGP